MWPLLEVLELAQHLNLEPHQRKHDKYCFLFQQPSSAISDPGIKENKFT